MEVSYVPEIFKLYRPDRREFDSKNPLGGSHHASVYRVDSRLDQKLLDMGYIDFGLGILDPGTIAKLPESQLLQHDAMVALRRGANVII